MRKIDYQILAAAIEKHRTAAIVNPLHTYENAQQALGAKLACEKIAGTFAQFAHVDDVKFLHACGIK